MSPEYEVIFDSGTSDLCFSIRKQKYIMVDGERVDIGLPERRAVAPGEFDVVEEFAPSLLPTFQALWTPGIIQSYKNLIADPYMGAQ